MKRFLFLTTVTSLMMGCATAPKPLRGEFSSIVPEQAVSNAQTGDSVRWGGRIVTVEPSAQSTCFEVVGRKLSGNARPVYNADNSHGRFIACRAGFYDPAIFTSERDITVTGRISGFETRPIGEHDYRYPRVEVDVIYLWPEQTQAHVMYYNDPFWPGYYNYWAYPRPPVVVRPAPRGKENSKPGK